MEIEWPRFGDCPPPPRATSRELSDRIAALLEGMRQRGLHFAVVYGDREHFANLAYLTAFDPRFEEAMLILSPERAPLLLTGNEGEGYLPVSPLVREGMLRTERFQSFSLISQPRGESRPLRDILKAEGLRPGSAVGCVGWKYFEPVEQADAPHAIELPCYLVDALRDICGAESVTNATDLLMHPGYGLRSRCSATEIAYFEYTNILASDGMRRMILGLDEGMTDYEVVKLAEYNGEPLGCHMTFVTGANREQSLSGPIGAPIRRGDPLAANVCYWGSNSCRAGWIASDRRDLPAAAGNYVEEFAGPYLEAVGEWFGGLRIGVEGGKIWELVQARLPFDRFGIYLNPGHLIHLDEWVSSPFFRSSNVPVRSGMAIQVDIIPSSRTHFSTRVEDGVVIADEVLRRELEEQHPGCFARCQARRRFMSEVLGIELPDEVLPLSNIPGIVPPFFLRPESVLVLG